MMLISTLGFTVLFLRIYIVCTLLQNQKIPECSSCSRDENCFSELCRRQKYVQRKESLSLASFKCENGDDCTNHKQCRSGICWKYLCVDGISSKRKKCTKTQCNVCSGDEDCSSGKCLNGQCSAKRQSIRISRAIEECGPCMSSSECDTRNCIKGKCVRVNISGREKCFPGIKNECEPCHNSDECKQGYCRWKRCTKAWFGFSSYCLKRQKCMHCRWDWQCRTGNCVKGSCLPELWEGLNCENETETKESKIPSPTLL